MVERLSTRAIRKHGGGGGGGGGCVAAAAAARDRPKTRFEPTAHRPDARTITRRGIRPHICATRREQRDGVSLADARTTSRGDASRLNRRRNATRRESRRRENLTARLFHSGTERNETERHGTVRYGVVRYGTVELVKRVLARLSLALLCRLCAFTFTKLMLVVVPSMSTSTVLAVKVSSRSWLRFSPAISTNDTSPTVGLIAMYIYMYGVPSRLGWRSRCVCRRRRVLVESRRTNSLLAVRQCVSSVCACVHSQSSPLLTARALIYPVTRTVSRVSGALGLTPRFAGPLPSL